jgi:chromosome segregation protein
LVYIKRIDLRGFKTFGKKTTVHLGRGLTIVTGPNGSGKSNILDSVKFALGELSPKELRGETISDLVHKGAQASTTRAAYVAVQFDNNDRRIPIDSEMVTISREFRRSGEGIYRVNGKRISRKQLTDILSSADIQVSGYNIVPQHAITRLAEVTTEERRKIIEDMIGIAVYDMKRASSEAELQQADLNLKVASAKIEEVRLRVESLERERNDYLKYVQLQKEVTHLRAKETSCKIRKLRGELLEIEQKTTLNQGRLQELKARKDELLDTKSQLDASKKEFDDTLNDKGSNRLLEIQRSMGDTSTRIASLRTYANGSEANIKALEKQIADINQKTSDSLKRVESIKNEIEELKRKQAELDKTMEEKNRLASEHYRGLQQYRQSLGQSTKDTEVIEQSIDKLTQRLIKFDGQIKASTSKIELLENHIQSLISKKDEYTGLSETIGQRIRQLEEIQQREHTNSLNTQKRIREYNGLKAQRTIEIKQAEDVSKRANTAFTEIDAQKKIAETLASEEKAINMLEEMAKAGVLPNVYGRLKHLIKIREEYSKATEAAAAGWLNALVVKDFETAVACIEILKRTKIGRVKLIPVKGLSTPQLPHKPNNIEGLIGALTDHLSFDEQFRPAINHVFGDTSLALSQKSAFFASLKGFRTVSVSGDVYETGGRMETGYYRRPIELASFFLSGKTIGQLKSTLTSLEGLTKKAKEDTDRIERELQELTKLSIQTENFIQSTAKEIANSQEHLQRTHKILGETELRIQELTREIGTEHAILQASSTHSVSLRSRLAEHEQNRRLLNPAETSVLLEIEEKHSTIENELNELVREKIEVESRLGSLNTSLSMLEASQTQAMDQINEIQQQLSELKASLESTLRELGESEGTLKQLETARDQLSGDLSVIKQKRDQTEKQLHDTETEIAKILDLLDPVNTELGTLTATSKNLQMQIDFSVNELRELGFSETLDVALEEIQDIQKTLSTLKKELSSIGGINELAVQQYEEVKDNYKHLATRIYELEREKLSIIQFMNELDKKKFETFMQAFNQVSRSFNEIFSTVTSGNGRLFLENQESPFQAGADIRLQFPGKTEMTIGSASGGEKSVGTVCFILALQSIHPMPFYMMDEIDAHLDVLNSQRLAELLKGKSQGSQFIIVSLKDVTITRADSVFGVFIQDGVSQVVSLPMQEAKVSGRVR